MMLIQVNHVNSKGGLAQPTQFQFEYDQKYLAKLRFVCLF